MENFTPISRRSAKCAMRTAWIHSGALRAPLCIQGDVMADFAGRREIGVKFRMGAASVDPKSTQLTPQKMIVRAPKIKLIFEFVSVFRLVFSCFTAPGARKTQKTKKNPKRSPLQ